MKTKNKFLIGATILIFFIGVIGCVIVMKIPHGSAVEIVRDGEALYSFDLEKTEDMTIDVETDGKINTIQIENGRIRIGIVAYLPFLIVAGAFTGICAQSVLKRLKV